MKEFFINENGITIVALIVLVIIIIILSGITIKFTVSDNGIVTQTQEVVDEQSSQIVEESNSVNNILKNK